MEESPIDEQIKALLKELMSKPFSAVEFVSDTEQKIKFLYQQNSSSISALIALLFCNLMIGKRDIALGLSHKIWSEGGELSDFFELVYADCLLNLGEFDKARDFLDPRLQNPRENLDYFYLVLVKYALVRGDLFLLMKLGEYPNIYEIEPALYDFAKKNALSTSAQFYRDLLKIIFPIIKDALCAFEYELYDDGIGLLIYTNATPEQNEEWMDLLAEKTNTYSEENEIEKIDGLSIQLLNISEHSPWLE